MINLFSKTKSNSNDYHESKEQLNVNVEKASFASKLCYSWIYPLLKRGSKHPLEMTDIPPLPTTETASNMSGKLFHIYRTISFGINFTDPKHSPNWCTRFLSSISPSVSSKTSRSVMALTARPLIIGGMFKPFWLLSAIAQALSIGYLTKNLTTEQDIESVGKGFWSINLLYVFIIAFSSIMMSITQHGVFYYSLKAAIKARGAIASQVYKKLLRISPEVFSRLSSEGKIGNLLVTDLQRIFDSFNYAHFAWFGVIEMVVFFGILYSDFGVSAVIGFALVIVLVPLQLVFSSMIAKGRAKVTLAADRRIQKMGDILSGIRMVKYEVLEQHFESVIKELRAQEIEKLTTPLLLKSVNSGLYFVVPTIISLIVFTSHTLLFGRELNPSNAFTSIALFSIMSRILILLPVSWLALSEGKVSFNRLDNFFDLPELSYLRAEDRLDIINKHVEAHTEIGNSMEKSKEISDVSSEGLELNLAKSIDEATSIEDNHSNAMVPRDSVGESDMGESKCKVKLDGVKFRLNGTGSEKEDTGKLKNSNSEKEINLWANDGEMVCIIGDVGSGKSNILKCIIGDLEKTNGNLKVEGKVAYCSQIPWIISGTVRDNIILFGAKFEDEDFDREWYENVINVCCLRQDLLNFPAGDLTEVDKITISGGQKARLSLARAVYSKPDIFILDDVLSAVDVGISKKLINCLLGVNGLLSKSTRIFATHNYNVLPHANRIMVVENGSISFCGDFDNLIQNSKYGEILNVKAKIEKNEVDEGADKTEQTKTTINIDPTQNEGQQNSNAGKLVKSEDRKYGEVSFRVFLDYVSEGGGVLAILWILFIFIGAQTLRQLAQIWIGRWTSTFDSNPNASFTEQNRYFVKTTWGLTISSLVLTILRSVQLAMRALAASKRLHNKLLNRILYAKLYFFDINPKGRILNRFSKDVDAMDMALPIASQDVLQIFILTVSSIITISWILPWILLTIPPILFCFICLQYIYKKSSRELKRLDGISFSPIYSNLIQSFSGASTIRAYGQNKDFIQNFETLVDTNHSTTLMFQTSGRWLGVRLDLLTALVIFVIGLVIILLGESIDRGLAGVALSESILLTGSLQWGTRQAAECENIFTSVERIITMTKETPIEENHHQNGEGKGKEVASNRDDEHWPVSGSVSFQNISMKYRSELEDVLQNLSFGINGQEKVGICGRSGSGKSSITYCLFNFNELSAGKIEIDGDDISEMPLQKLRKAISIVPQDPIFFNGTIRENLDPESKKSDAILWDVLEKVGMASKLKHGSEGPKGQIILDSTSGLDTIITDDGGNFSIGEKQLLSLARAILFDSKIIVLDEASSSLDQHSDEHIQKVVRQEFRDKTIIIIAHRLETLKDCDKILVLEKGTLVEFDTPENLLKLKGKYFEMVKISESGKMKI